MANSSRGQNLTGIWLATVGLAALLVQTVLGLYLQDKQLRERRSMHSRHRLMFVLGVTVIAHVWLNG